MDQEKLNELIRWREKLSDEFKNRSLSPEFNTESSLKNKKTQSYHFFNMTSISSKYVITHKEKNF